MVNYNEQKNFWRSINRRRNATHSAVRAFAQPKVEIITKECNLNKGSTVLDVGAGNGLFSYYFAEIVDTTVFDFSKEILSSNPVNKKVVGDAEHLPFKDKSFGDK